MHVPSLKLACVVTLCVALAAFPAQKQDANPAAPAGTDPEVIDAQGYQQALARHKGKPLMVNFWATWCEPCRDEYPRVNDVARKFAPQGLVVIGVSMDEDAEMNLVRRFLARHAPVFRNYRMKPGTFEAFVKSVDPSWKGSIPTTFFYTPDGKLFARLAGEQQRESFEKAVEGLLAASRPKAK